MELNKEEKAMASGELGEAVEWAINHQIQVGNFFDAKNFVPVSNVHMMIDPESVGIDGVLFLEKLVGMEAKVKIPMITDPRGVDLNYYTPLGQTEEMANIERRTIKACTSMGILMTNTCVNYQTIMAPILGEHLAYGDTGVVIYSNSVCGARSNFEGGPSALAAGLTGRPNVDWCESNKQSTVRVNVMGTLNLIKNQEFLIQKDYLKLILNQHQLLI